MGSVTLVATGMALDIVSENVIRMWKPIESGDTDPTAIKLVGGVIVVEESIRTILARLGGESGFSHYDSPRTSRPAVVALKEIAALTKACEESETEDDLTIIHLADGEMLIARESIRTLSARLSIAGIENVDMDIIGTQRPANVVPGHVVSIDSMDAPDLPDDAVAVILRSGKTFLCRSGRLRSEIAGTMKW